MTRGLIAGLFWGVLTTTLVLSAASLLGPPPQPIAGPDTVQSPASVDARSDDAAADEDAAPADPDPIPAEDAPADPALADDVPADPAPIDPAPADGIDGDFAPGGPDETVPSAPDAPPTEPEAPAVPQDDAAVPAPGAAPDRAAESPGAVTAALPDGTVLPELTPETGTPPARGTSPADPESPVAPAEGVAAAAPVPSAEPSVNVSESPVGPSVGGVSDRGNLRETEAPPAPGVGPSDPSSPEAPQETAGNGPVPADVAAPTPDGMPEALAGGGPSGPEIAPDTQGLAGDLRRPDTAFAVPGLDAGPQVDAGSLPALTAGSDPGPQDRAPASVNGPAPEAAARAPSGPVAAPDLAPPADLARPSEAGDPALHEPAQEEAFALVPPATMTPPGDPGRPPSPVPPSAEPDAQPDEPDPAIGRPDAALDDASPADTPLRPTVGLQREVPGVQLNRLPTIGADAGDRDDAAEPAEAAIEGEEAVEDDARPALLRNAAPFDNPGDRPLFAIILRDDGTPAVERENLARLPFPVTFAIDPVMPGAAEAAAVYRAAGQEVLMIASAIPQGATASDLAVTFQSHFSTLGNAIAAIDMPQGGFQNNRLLSQQVVALLGADGYGLVTFDQGLNPAEQVARSAGLATARVFRILDAEGENLPTIRRYLDRALFRAGQEGAVIVMGRADHDTLSAILEWRMEGRADAVALAPVSAVLLRGQ